ncbi:MAG: N-acetylmuramoyl-L-alanine amidase [Bacteroidota bacterium]
MKQFILLLALSGFAFSQTNDSLFLRIVIPERDTLQYGAYRHRIAASTNPTSRAFINYKEVKVYGSGAFVGLHYLASDTSVLHIAVVGTKGDSLTKDFVFIKPAAKTYPPDEIYIESVSSPSEDMWLTTGDILEVRMKGSSGKQPEFEIEGVESGIPMTEQIAKNGTGTGTYIGRYKIEEDDECVDAAVKVSIKKNFFSSVEEVAKGKVSIIQDSLPRVVETLGKRPFLNAGLGTDRLGGAKLGFLVEGVRLTVTGKVGRQYRVKLSDGMESWLPEDNCTLLPIDTPLPITLTGSISVTGNDSEDVVRVGLGQRVPYTSEQLTDPSAIVVNIFGASSNTNWITHQLSSQGIQMVKTAQVGAEHFQMTILLNYKQHWGYDISYEGNSMRVKVRRPPAIADSANVLSKLTIAIDAGHGIGSEGAKGATGVIEKDVTLALAKELNAQLQAKGIKTVMTRENDSNVFMSDRTDKILAGNAHILVSIHCNSIGESSDPDAIKGTSTYYRYPGFKSLSDIMYAKMLELGLDQWGVTGNFNFSLSGPTQFPNVLVETAFLSNPDDEMKLIDPAFRKKIAEKIISGLEEFVKNYSK